MVETNLKIQNIFEDLECCASPLEVAFKAFVDALSLSVKTKFEANRIKVLFIYFWKQYNSRLNLRKVFKLLNLSKSTYYENAKKIVNGVIYDRKIREDSKVNDIKYQTKALEISDKTKKRVGIDKSAYLFNSSEYEPDLTLGPNTGLL